MDAVLEIIREATKAAAYTWKYRRFCAVITLDVQNALNSASWQVILKKLQNRGIEDSLTNIIRSYLSERKIEYQAEKQKLIKSGNSRVPQGSILGPTLWNVQYDSVLKLKLPEGVKIIGFADDIAVVAVARKLDSYEPRK